MSGFNDEPTVEDKLTRDAMVKSLGDEIAHCAPPKVYGVHGEWGSGKTSFLYQLQLYLTGSFPQAMDRKDEAANNDVARDLWGHRWKPREKVTVIWFDAWQYQNEKAPIVALLQEIRHRLPMMRKVWGKALDLGTVALESTLMNLDNLTKIIGFKVSEIKKVGESYEKERHAYQLPGQQIRGLLEKAIEPFVKGGGRMVILVDDLDRCEPEVAFRLLEGIKIYLNLKHFVFVLGMDQRIIERAIARSLSHIRRVRERELLAREYLDKICQDIRQLTLVKAPENYIAGLFPNQTELAKEALATVSHYKLLPMNPRKIKTFAAVLSRFLKVPPPEDLELIDHTQCTRRSGILVLAAALYHFHHKIFKQLQADLFFYEQVRDFAKTMRSEHIAFASLRQNKSTQPINESTPTPEKPRMDLNMQFPHPSDDDVFRVRQLVVDLRKVGDDEWERYLYNQF